MALCSDPRLTYLNQLGYNVLKLPREGVEPLQVLGRDGKSLENLGGLSKIWKSSVPEPSPEPPAAAADLNGQKTSNLKLSVGLDILSAILQGMGASTPKVEAAYSRAKAVQFTITNAQVIRVAPLDVGHYLANGDLDTGNSFVSYFNDHDKEAFVITEVLKSNAIKVSAKSDTGVSVGVDLPQIQQAVGAHVKVETTSGDNSDVTYTGQHMLTFGFKVFGIAFANGTWQIHGVAPGPNVAFALPHEPTPVLLAPGRMMTEFPVSKLREVPELKKKKAV